MRTSRYDVDASSGVLRVVRRRDGATIGSISLDAELTAAILAELSATGSPASKPKPKPALKKKPNPDAGETQSQGDRK